MHLSSPKLVKISWQFDPPWGRVPFLSRTENVTAQLQRVLDSRVMLPGSEALSQLLGALYDAVAEPAQWDSFLEKLGLQTRATSAGLLIHDFGHAKYSLSSSWRISPESLRLYQEHYYALDVWAQKGLAKPVGYICSSQSLCSVEEIKTTEIYNDFMVRAGIEHGMFGLLDNSKSCLASVSLYRDRSHPEFTQSDLHLLQFLAPHIQRAFKLHRRFAELTSHSSGIETALNMLATGIVFMGSHGEIILMNRSAAALVAERDGLLAARDGLRAERPNESNLLASTIREAASTSNGKGLSAGTTVLISRRSRPPLHVLISPIHNSMIPTSKNIAAGAFINDPLRSQRPAREALHALFGLSPAECRVALLFVDGYSPRQISDILGVTNNTVRSQIRSIFSKTGVKRQAELIRLLLTYSEPTIQPQPTA
jgi:DNA-binding CsgD family transcriptional regulator